VDGGVSDMAGLEGQRMARTGRSLLVGFNSCCGFCCGGAWMIVQ
jgi:hypothetical protein